MAKHHPIGDSQFAGLKSSGRMLESAVPRNWFLQSIPLLTGEQKWPDIFNALPYM